MLTKIFKLVNNVLDFMEVQGISLTLEYNRNQIDQGIGTFGSSGSYADADYYNQYGEYPYQTRLREYNVHIQTLNEQHMIEESNEEPKTELITFF